MKKSQTAPSVRLLKLVLAQKWFKALHLTKRKGRELKAEYQQLDQELDKEAMRIEESTATEEKGTKNTTASITYNSVIASLASPARSQDDTPCKEIYLRHILPEAIFQKAPKYVLKAIIELNPNILLTLPDENGRLPLHVACLDGASLSTISMLLALESPKGIHCNEHFSEQASVVDYSNRTPLHYAIERLISCCKKESKYTKIYDSDEAMIAAEKSRQRKEETLKIISCLIKLHPDAVLHADDQNDTPIDLLQKARRIKTRKKRKYYKQDYETIEDTCRLLRVAAVDVYRKRKLRYEMMGCDSYNKETSVERSTRSVERSTSTAASTHFS